MGVVWLYRDVSRNKTEEIFATNKAYLEQAKKIAAFLLSHPNLPADKIPYWDFNAPGIPNEERDASAAAIAASALFELSQYSKGMLKKQYLQTAVKTLESLCSEAYKAKLGENNNFLILHCVGHKPANSEVDVPLVYANFILKHSVGSIPHNSEVDVPLNYADYYFLEALLRYNALKKKS